MTLSQLSLAIAATALMATGLMILLPEGNWLSLLFLSVGSAALGALAATATATEEDAE